MARQRHNSNAKLNNGAVEMPSHTIELDNNYILNCSDSSSSTTTNNNGCNNRSICIESMELKRGTPA
ncbi:hypothetical protein MAR_029081 [Mya arenaria]|uniref:Uncharacterized protein n=1 Tax=Mya arenaria TaxID=6604 RepID=A0ABY7DFE5_MYAAR|nr:hypothetical protein MAR_029081 [Mya arenaria]